MRRFPKKYVGVAKLLIFFCKYAIPVSVLKEKVIVSFTNLVHITNRFRTKMPDLLSKFSMRSLSEEIMCGSS